ncbi:PspC domain-containing protein [Blastococcus brunescens]|uniref:PspC domain-containing protein n=1 Tax=Blastococcus brunescens TaxID=1564165 RepID=A0ABZ1AZV1_9ACTN|nr:PspC domain-containing protein [Blastococcus sp. BMG 8361]WRL63031.1 PspC domain-containing protein [Blastococcus sp. BMG 8361]
MITGVGGAARGATIEYVTTAATGTPPGTTADRPPLARPRSGRLMAGVAAGTAAHLRQDPLVVRVAFVVLASFGIGVVMYGLLWLTMPVATPGEDPTPGRCGSRDPRASARCWSSCSWGSLRSPCSVRWPASAAAIWCCP